jgi:hypothetical protein
MGAGIALSHEQSKSQILSNFSGKGATSAGFVSTFLAQQAAREARTAHQLLSGREALNSRFQLIVTKLR